MQEVSCAHPGDLISTVITVILISASSVNWACRESSVAVCQPCGHRRHTALHVSTHNPKAGGRESPSPRLAPFGLNLEPSFLFLAHQTTVKRGKTAVSQLRDATAICVF